MKQYPIQRLIVSGGVFLVASDLWFLCLVDFICDPAVTCAIPELVSDSSEFCDSSVIAPGLMCLLQGLAYHSMEKDRGEPMLILLVFRLIK